VDPKQTHPRLPGGVPAPDSRPDPAFNSPADEFFKHLQTNSPAASSTEALAAARLAMQRIAAESAGSGAEDSLSAAYPAGPLCDTCGHQNRTGSRFCGLCGLPLNPEANQAFDETANAPPPMPEGQHHYHHHYHHHYFASSADPAALGPRASSSDPIAAKVRSLGPGVTMSRVETAVRKVMQDWARACNNRHLDDLVSTYSPDALVLRPNHPAVRGSAAIREFFFAILDAGLGDVELDPIRLDVVGDVAYEAGRCKMLVPVAVSKRREEKGKYLAVLARQPNGEWAIVCDCWSSDLNLTGASEGETAKPASSPALPALPPKSVPPRRTP
jgi:ketosteroid isomerase-like protein